MDESLRASCARYGVHYQKDPAPLSRESERAWLIEDTSGSRWVIKNSAASGDTAEVLSGFSALQPPFRYTRPASRPEEPFLLYPYIDGHALSEGLFEGSETFAQVMELIGRVQAVLRSLILVPYYRKSGGTPSSDEADGEAMPRWAHGQAGPMMDRQLKEARVKEISQSFQWTRQNVARHCELLEGKGPWPKDLLEHFRQAVGRNFSLHVPVTGNSLAHTALHPEHVIRCPDGTLGIVGWDVAPRPRFYMRGTYFAWSFLRSCLEDPIGSYPQHLLRGIAGAFHREQQMVFALCLLEQSVHPGIWEGDRVPGNSPHAWEGAVGMFRRCVETL